MSYITIQRPVGKQSPNTSPDVMAIQIMINHFSRNHWMPGQKKLGIDGDYGTNTAGAVQYFLALYAPTELPSGRIMPSGEAIRCMNKHAGQFGGPPPPKPAKPEIDPASPKAPDRPTPASFVRTVWPVPALTGRFEKSGRATSPVPPETAFEIPFGKYESKVFEAGYLAFKFSLEGKGEVKTNPGDKAAVKEATSGAISGGGKVSTADGLEVARKAAVQLDKQIKLEIESAWSPKDLAAFEQGLAKGKVDQLGKDLAAAKLNFTVLEWYEVEFAANLDFPCMFAAQAKFNLPLKWLLEAEGVSKADIDAMPVDAKVEFSGTLHFGPSSAALKRIGKRIGREALEGLLTRAGPRLLSAFRAAAFYTNVVLLAVEFVGYQIALFNYLVKNAQETGEWRGQTYNYAKAYALTVGDRASYIKAVDNIAPTVEGRRVQDAGVHDARLAMRKWGAGIVAAALVERFGEDDVTGDPLEWMEAYEHNAELIGTRFAHWMQKNPSVIEGQVVLRG